MHRPTMVLLVFLRIALIFAALLAALFFLSGCQRTTEPTDPAPAPASKPPVVLEQPQVEKAKPAVSQSDNKDKDKPAKFDNKILFNKVRDELAESHPLLADPDKRLAWVQRWTFSDAAFALFPTEDETKAKIDQMIASCGGTGFISKKKDEHTQSTSWGSSEIHTSLGFSPHFGYNKSKQLAAGLTPKTTLDEITARLKVAPDLPLLVGTFSGGKNISEELYSNDQIVSVNGKAVEGMYLEQVMAELYQDGKKSSTMVIRRDNFKGGFVEKTVTVTPTNVLRTPMEHKVLDNGVHYVRLSEIFDRRPMTSMLAKMLIDASSGRGIILDLRDCGGDSGDAYWPLIEFFLQRGTLFQEVYRRKDAVWHNAVMVTEHLLITTHPFGYADDPTPSISYQERFQRPIVPAKLPVVVLINGNLSTSAEMFAGALQGNKRARLVGTETTACGVDRSRMFPKEMPFGYYLYIHDYMRMPAGRDPSQFRFTPVVPDVVVTQPADKSSDAQLEAARTEMKKQLGD